MTILSPPKLLIRLLVAWSLSLALISCGIRRPFDSLLTSAADEYQAGLRQGRHYLGKREHSRALGEFIKAGKLRPEQAEPLLGRAKALFYLERSAEVLPLCAELSGKAADGFTGLGFCWGARLEISGNTPESRRQVREEIDKLLEQPEPSAELLFSAYQGYYDLHDKEKSVSLILRLAEMAADSSLAEDIASSLFAEIVGTEPQSAARLKLADSYIRNFPDEHMADQAAAVVLRDLAAKPASGADYWRIARTVLRERETKPLINGAVAYWLIEHDTGYDHAIRLLQKNLQGLPARQAEAPADFDQALWRRRITREGFLYQYLLGRAWLGQGHPAKARAILEKVVLAQKNWPGAYHFLGMIAVAAGRDDEAIEYFRAALARGGVRPETGTELRRLLADGYGFTGEPRDYFQTRSAGPKFRDVTEMAGLGGVKATRVAWGDYDQDGDDDLLLDGRRLFTNRAPDGFTAAGAPLIPVGRGANGGVWGDYDNDGFPDLFVTSHQGNYLLHNEGGTQLTGSGAWSAAAGGLPAGSEAAAWGDVNNDGYLDLYVANYEHGKVLRGQCGQDQFYLNHGGGDFAESRVAAGLVSEEAMCGRGVTWSDLNGDGRQDIMVSNYRLDPNFLWLNQGNGSLIDAAEAAGVRGHEVGGAYGHSIGSVSGDLDGDGDFDLYTSNLAHPRYIEFSDLSMVLLNNGERSPRFVDRFLESGIDFDETSSDPLLFDVDNDGDLDLFVTSIYPKRSSHLYLNDGKASFTDQTWLAGAEVLNGWGAAWADYDGDGYLDLLVASSEGVRLLHNEGGNHNWLAIKIDDRHCNRFGVGSRVTINYGQESQVREITAGRGTGSQDSLTAHFGLGNYSGPVSVQVKTLCGETIRRQIPELNRIVLFAVELE
jgi:tetratricopeptide (TPR) repeat protein